MTIKNKLYSGEVELIFDSFKHKYTYAGENIPSVTTVLSVLNKPALVNWAANMAIDCVSEAITPGKSYDELELAAIWDAGRKAHFQKKVDAGNIGAFVHKWVEQYIKGENPPVPVNEDLKDSIQQFLDWVAEHKVKFLASEQMIFSRKFKYTGTLDFICYINGKMYLGDLKTSNGIYPEYFMQTAAYRLARSEEFPTEKYEGQLVVRIGKDGSFQFAVCRDPKAYNRMLVGFLSALKLWESLEILKEFKAENE